MIGILGGTFDPVHHGHLRVALDVLQALELEQLRLIPLKQPPHRDIPQASDEQRLRMLQAAIEGESLLEIDHRELDRDGTSYTLHTLESLKQEQPQQTFCLLLGSDAFRHFPSWHQPEQILQLAHIVVMLRPGEACAAHHQGAQTRDAADLRNTTHGRILVQPVTQLDISSTRIRELLAQGQSPRYFLPQQVLQIILDEGIYPQSRQTTPDKR